MSPFYLVNLNLYIDAIEDVARAPEATVAADRFMRELLRPYQGATYEIIDVYEDGQAVNISVQVDGLVKHI